MLILTKGITSKIGDVLMKKILTMLTLIIMVFCFTACKDDEEELNLTPLEKFERNLDNSKNGFYGHIETGVSIYRGWANCQIKGNLMHIDSYTLLNEEFPETYIEIVYGGYYLYEKRNNKWTYKFKTDTYGIVFDTYDIDIDDFDLVNEKYKMKQEKLDELGYKSVEIKVNEDCNGGYISAIKISDGQTVSVCLEVTEDANVKITLPIDRNKE